MTGQTQLGGGDGHRSAAAGGRAGGDGHEAPRAEHEREPAEHDGGAVAGATHGGERARAPTGGPRGHDVARVGGRAPDPDDLGPGGRRLGVGVGVHRPGAGRRVGDARRRGLAGGIGVGAVGVGGGGSGSGSGSGIGSDTGTSGTGTSDAGTSGTGTSDTGTSDAGTSGSETSVSALPSGVPVSSVTSSPPRRARVEPSSDVAAAGSVPPGPLGRSTAVGPVGCELAEAPRRGRLVQVAAARRQREHDDHEGDRGLDPQPALTRGGRRSRA